MKVLIFSLVLISFGKVSGEDDEENGTVINYELCGQNFPNSIVPGPNTNVGETPWIALVGREEENDDKVVYACTGALINARYVLTTAQCILMKRDKNSTPVSRVRLGEHNLRSERDCFRTRLHPCVVRTTTIEVNIEETIAHPNYYRRNYQSDNIALIRLEETIDLSRYYGFINPICLPSAKINPRIYFQDRLAEIVGWDFGSGHANDILMRESVSLADDSVCSKMYRGFEAQTQICMKSKQMRKRCIGDSGSPLALPGPAGPPYLLVGILSYGPIPCESSDTPAVFTSVSYYRDWIDQNIRPYELL